MANDVNNKDYRVRYEREVIGRKADQQQNMILIKENKELKAKVRELEENNKKLNLLITNSTDDKNVIKKILSLYAEGYIYSSIANKLKFLEIKYQNTEYIKRVCETIDELDADLQLHYKQSVKAYEESIRINSDVLKNDMIRGYRQLINDCSLDLEGCETITEKSKLRQELKDHYKELNKVLGNVIEDKDSSLDKTEEVNKVMENHNKSKLISFKAIKKKVE